MKLLTSKISLTLSLLWALSLCSTAQDAQKDTASNTNSLIANPVQKPEDLTPEKRKEFNEKVATLQKLFRQKRIFDSLQTIDEIDEILPDNPVILNIKGACYVEIRAFDKARAVFEKVLTIAPGNSNARFNLAEVDFVTRNWQSAHNGFSRFISKLNKSNTNNKSILRLCQFKLLLCKLKTNRIDEAKALSEKYDEWDDSPFYYYSRAAILFNQGDKMLADKEILKARMIWNNEAALASWKDTLMEFGYIRSFYSDQDIQNNN